MGHLAHIAAALPLPWCGREQPSDPDFQGPGRRFTLEIEAMNLIRRRADVVVASRPRTSAARQTSGLPPAQPTNRHA
jgi:hypothetical protein